MSKELEVLIEDFKDDVVNNLNAILVVLNKIAEPKDPDIDWDSVNESGLPQVKEAPKDNVLFWTTLTNKGVKSLVTVTSIILDDGVKAYKGYTDINKSIYIDKLGKVYLEKDDTYIGKIVDMKSYYRKTINKLKSKQKQDSTSDEEGKPFDPWKSSKTEKQTGTVYDQISKSA